jgi:hypothetical protein
MARQMLRQKYEADLKKINEIKDEKHEDIKDLEKSNKALGVKRLGQILTHRMYARDIAPSNKYRKIEK